MLLGSTLVLGVLVELSTPHSSSQYPFAVFSGAFLATAMVTMLLVTSRDLSDLANTERRLTHERAVVALVFDARGRVLLHFQSPHRATSWPEHWVPPGGLLEDGASEDSAQERLRLLVDDEHPWGRALPLASTNDSSAYRKMNKREEQVPVQVNAYWVEWSDEDAWVPEDAFDGFHSGSLRLASLDDMPEPIPPYYPELFKYLDAVRRGDNKVASLECWTIPETHDFKARWEETD
jgi:8-oxo-dGTP pyrophosphatase MutT (NUDIX family)